MNNLLKTALSQYGIKEIPGVEDNPEILKYFEPIGQFGEKDETAWCSAFINWCCYKSGLQYTKKLNARSWLNIGEKVDNPKVGDIVIFWRESVDSWKGHVGLYINENGKDIYVLGGNQDNMVCIKTYPKYQLLGYRRLNNE